MMASLNGLSLLIGVAPYFTSELSIGTQAAMRPFEFITGCVQLFPFDVEVVKSTVDYL